MISILVVEDDPIKYGRIFSALKVSGVKEDEIKHASTAAESVSIMSKQLFDLLLLDVNVPLRLGEGPRRGGGVNILKEIRVNDTLKQPTYIVGITAFEDVISEFGSEFTESLWALILYAENSDHWATQIKSKVEYILAINRSSNFRDGITYGLDVAVICALEGTEFEAVKNLSCAWQPMKFEFDETRYISGTIEGATRGLSIVAASASRMGMPATAVLAAKMIALFRPRYVVMVGICAGRSTKVGLGDIIVGDPCWDWGSGKITVVDNIPKFLPAPHQLELDTDVRATIKELGEDVTLMASIKRQARGNKPPSELRVHLGPIASGAAVVADSATFASLLDRQRDLLGLEMEAYGVMVACRGSGKPRPIPIVIKSVCDFADHGKDDDFQEYAAHTSALFFQEVARKLL